MHRIHFATKTFIATSLSILLITSSHAAVKSNKSAHKAANNGQVVVEDTKGTSQEEIAAVDIMNEICPQILGQNNNKNFQKGYNNLLHELLPSIKSPALSVQAMHTDSDYMNILNNARAKASAESIEDNREICLDILHYPAAK